MYYLSSVSNHIGKLMVESMRDATTPLHLAIYIDECHPSNPLRPDSGRERERDDSYILFLFGLACLGPAAVVCVAIVRRSAVKSSGRPSWRS